MKHSLSVIYVVLFALLGLSSMYILHHDRTHKHPIFTTTINSFIIHAKFTEYNTLGQVKTIITADRVTHFQQSGISIFEKPYIISYTEKNRTPWHIHANRAISNKSGDKIILRGHVIVHQLPTSLHAEATIKTTELTIFPKASRAVTNKAVTIIRPGTIINGTGFTANLKTGRYELRSESNAIYDINEAKQKTEQLMPSAN